MNAPFLYNRLSSADSIRLVSLQPGQGSDPIVVELQECELASAPCYDAISYVWGDSTDTVTINCNAEPLEITINLHWALNRIRHVIQPVVLWADAICINQADVDERSNQVGMMGAIFGSARQVYLCMGDAPDGGAQDACALITGLALLWPDGSIPNLSDGDRLKTDRRWHSIATLKERPWFNRVWVIQEAGLAKDARVLYGAAEFGYGDLLRTIDWLKFQDWSHNFSIPSLLIHSRWSDWRHGRQRGPDYMRLFDILSHGAMLSCSDPRDHVYAFLGHSCAQNEDGNPIMVPDYSKGFDEVFREASMLLLPHIGLRLLSSVEHTDKTITEDIPSWVVRWDIAVVDNDICQRPLYYRAASQWAQAATSWIVRTPSHAYGLLLRGIVLDQVRYSYLIDVSNGVELMAFHDTGSNSVLSFTDMTIKLSLLLKAHTDLAQAALVQTLTAERHHVRKQNSDQWTIERLHTDIRRLWVGRSLIITTKGYVGIAPLITRPGDACCALFGADAFSILRPSADPSAYRLLGEAYVRGVMNGELGVMLERGRVTDEHIVIY